MINLERLLRVPHVEPDIGFDISSDNKKVALSWNKTGAWEIYEVFLDGSSPIRQVSSGPGAKFGPKYAPDGKTLIYGADFDGGEKFHIISCDLVTGKQVDLTPDIFCSQHPYLDWSPDGRRIAFVSNESGTFSVHVMNADGSDRRLVMDNGMPAWSARWSSDGRWLAILNEAYGQDFNVNIVPADGGDAIPICVDKSPIYAGHPTWSPDSRRLAFNSNYRGVQEIGIFDLKNHEITWLTDGEGILPEWSPDGTHLAFIHNHGTDSWLAVEEFGKVVKKFQIEPGVHYGPKFTHDGTGIVLVFDSPRRTDDLWIFDLSSSAFRQLTHSMPPELSDAGFVIPEEVRYPGLDGEMVPALLFKPKCEKPGPAVIIIHGGPSWLFPMLWYPIMAHMASRGWVVLAPNYRGSTGYGREWQMANHFDLGGVDTQDCAAGALYLANEELADPDRIAVTGRSHGGYLTMTCLTQYPDLWAGGSAIVPFLNWFTSHENSRADLQHWDRENMGDPVENHDLWYERSPFYFLERIQSPVQLVCGENDPRCPATESIQARDKLVALEKEVDFILYPNEGHSFLKIENIVNSEIHRVEFLAKCLED